MKTLLALATGALFLPALAGGALARTTPGVHLMTSIRVLSRAPDAVRYAVTVRPVGGPARATTLVLGTRRPAVWTAAAPGCLSSGDRTALACDLGDVRESESRTLRLTGRPGASGPAEVPVVAQVTAANAPSVTSSLGAVRPAARRLPRGKAFAPIADERPAGQESPDPEPSPSAESPAAESPAVESPAAQAAPDGSPAAESPSAQPSESEPAVSHAVRPLGGPPAKRPKPAAGPHQVPGAPKVSVEPQAAHALPRAPIIPHMPVPDVPDVPGAAATASPPPILPGGPAVPLPGASAPAALPQIATHPSPDEGISELSTMSPAGAMQAGRTSWATLIAVAVVTEASLLWLVAGFTVWRRKRVRKSGRHSRVRSRRLLLSRLLP